MARGYSTCFGGADVVPHLYYFPPRKHQSTQPCNLAPDAQNAHVLGEIPDQEGSHCYPDQDHNDKQSVGTQLRRAAAIQEPTAPAQ